MVFAGHATDVVRVSWVVVATTVVGTAPAEQVIVTKGVEGNAVPLKVMTPEVATPPEPTSTEPASGVLPATTAGVPPKPLPTVGRASTFNRLPIVSALFAIERLPFAALRNTVPVDQKIALPAPAIKLVPELI